ncbi:MAG: DUF3105 domain-containing protein [Egibacteraceae bacterium]
MGHSGNEQLGSPHCAAGERGETQVETRQPVPRGARLVPALLGLIPAALTIILIVAGAVTRAERDPQGSVPPGVAEIPVAGREHVQRAVAYAQTPPAGGDHAAVWQDCGAYDVPVASEAAAHSLEHGAVWVTYRPDLPADQVITLRSLAQPSNFVLVSPFGGLPSPVVASAWGTQLPLDADDDPRLEAFVVAFAQGPQTPEPGAPCSGGTAEVKG